MHSFIHQLLEEAENERMHLLTFMKVRDTYRAGPDVLLSPFRAVWVLMLLLDTIQISQPSLFFRFLILGAQGVFYNLFFLVSPV